MYRIGALHRTSSTIADRSLTLVTGATGAVGPRVVEALHGAGYRVRTFSIDPPKPGSFPKDIEVHTGDLADKAALRSAMDGVEVVIHMAALLHVVSPSPDLEHFKRINVGGTAAVIDAANQLGIQRLVFFSTIAVYGPSKGEIFDEGSPPRPGTWYAQTKLEAERLVLGAKRLDGQPLGTVLRFGAIYGAGIKGNYRGLVQSLARRRFVPIGNGRNRRSLIYDKDVASAALLAATHPAAQGQTYNVTDGQLHTVGEIIEIICRSLGRKPPRLSLPLGPVRATTGVIEQMAKTIRIKPPIGRETIDKYVEDAAVESRLFQSELGFRPRFDLSSGWRETIDDMRNRGELS
jgi:nucleoside-diphosphate-sugar epimerase